MRGGEEDIDDDDQLIDRGLDCPKFALLYAPDTGFLFGFLHLKVVYMFQGIVHASFS